MTSPLYLALMHKKPPRKATVIGALRLGAEADGLGVLSSVPPSRRHRNNHGPVKVHWGQRGGAVDSTYTP